MAAAAPLMRPLRQAASPLLRRCFASAPGRHGLVVGSGSNVIDIFFRLRKLPQPGEKCYFADESCVSGTVVGGVTLNHLSWARALGTPTALMALQGTDANGVAIRAKMQELGVSTRFVRASDVYSTSVSHILSDPSGERTIIMAPASTSQLRGEKMEAEFAEAVAGSAMVTTEISQVPLSGVEYLLRRAKSLGLPSLLDVDVTPAVAVGPAQLGTMAELKACVTQATVLKLTASAAAELLALVSNAALESRLENVAAQLADAFGARLCVVTDGSRGSALACGSAAGARGRATGVLVPIYAGVTQRDATGAGDAFFGGIVAGLHAWGVPSSPQQVERVGKVAAAAGAACVEVIGALPVPGVSDVRMVQLNADCAQLVEAGKAASRQQQVGSGSVGVRAASASGAAAAPVAVGVAAAAVQSAAADAASLALLSASFSAPETARHQTACLARLVDACLACSSSSGRHHLWVTGIGKSGAVAARLAISLRSVGVAASFVHGAEWAHGDLGAVRAGDAGVCLSHSGRTAELAHAMPLLRARGVAALFALTGDTSSPMAELARGAPAGGHLLVPCGPELLGAVPTRSIVAQEAAVNALLHAVAVAAGLTREGFKANHPGGAIGAAAALR